MINKRAACQTQSHQRTTIVFMSPGRGNVRYILFVVIDLKLVIFKLRSELEKLGNDHR